MLVSPTSGMAAGGELSYPMMARSSGTRIPLMRAAFSSGTASRSDQTKTARGRSFARRKSAMPSLLSAPGAGSRMIHPRLFHSLAIANFSLGGDLRWAWVR